jgi:type I restriction enzyme, S subunit
MDKDIFLNEFGHLAQGPDGIKKLRDLILQLAVQGKLVEQDANDEPASVLLEKIGTERNRLIAAKQAKAEKTPTKIKGKELLPSIPCSWEWAHLVELCHFENGDRSKNYPSKSVLVESGIPFINAGHLVGNYVSLDEMNFITDERYDLLRSGKIQENDLLFCLRGTLGKTAIVKGISTGAIASSLVILRAFKGLLSEYLLLVLKSPISQTLLKLYDNGTAQPNLSATDLKKFYIPLPPLAEQKRIVAKVDELMALCDDLEASQNAHTAIKKDCVASTFHHLSEASEKEEIKTNWSIAEGNFNNWFDNLETVKNLRATILQLAVQGKLVEQDPNDEPASVFLERIKASLPETKGKKKKQVSISLDDVPFEIPKNWTWAHFPELGEFGRGKSKHRPRNDPKLYSGGKIPLVQTGDVARSGGEITTHTALYNQEGLAQSRLWKKGTMCITIAANIADTGILKFDACFPDSVVGFVPSCEFENARYFEYFVRTAKQDLLKFAPSTAQKNINLGILEQVAIPLPPLAEQKRIVSKVDELMSLCDQLESQIKSSEELNRDLMASLVHHMLAA